MEITAHRAKADPVRLGPEIIEWYAGVYEDRKVTIEKRRTAVKDAVRSSR